MLYMSFLVKKFVVGGGWVVCIPIFLQKLFSYVMLRLYMLCGQKVVGVVGGVVKDDFSVQLS